jgi:uncharacterized membrane protein YhaH (DUF805 family)
MTQEYHPSLRSWFNPTPEERAANRRLFLSFQGRVGRRTYWRFAAAPALAFTMLTVLFDLPLRMGSFGFTVCALLLCWVVLAVSVKRCHDRGRSGWFLLVKLIPIVGALWVLVDLGFLPAAEGAARFEARSPGELAEAADA